MAPAWPLARALACGRPPTRRLRIISPSPVRSRPTLVAACGRPPARLLLHASLRRLAVSLWSRSAAVRSGRPRLPCSTFPSPRPSPPHPRASRQSPISPYTSSSAVAPSARWRRPNCRPSRPGTSRPHAPPHWLPCHPPPGAARWPCAASPPAPRCLGCTRPTACRAAAGHALLHQAEPLLRQ